MVCEIIVEGDIVYVGIVLMIVGCFVVVCIELDVC